MLTNADMTIYNKYDGKYLPTHLYGVFWNDTKAFNTNKSGLQSADSLTLYIPFNVNCDKPYQSKGDYDGTCWTLQTGDIVVKGTINDSIRSVTDLNGKYSHVHIVTSIDTMDFGSYNMRHFQVGGK